MSALNHQMLAVVCVIIALGVIGLAVALRESYQAMKLRTSMSTPNQVREIRSPARGGEEEKQSTLFDEDSQTLYLLLRSWITSAVRQELRRERENEPQPR